MPAEVVTGAEQMPRRARYLIPRDLPRRGEILAALAVAAVLAHLLLAQLTIVLAVAFHGVTKTTRWRLWWLAAPAAIGVAWTLATGPAAAAAGFAEGPRHVLAYLGASGHEVSHLLHLGAAFSGIGAWLPRQFPLALIAGAAEAAVAGWLAWLHTDEWAVAPPRPGLLAAARRGMTRRAIRSGSIITRDGVCLGVVPKSGARACLAWREVTGGTLFAGTAGPDLTAASFQLVHAALRRRKPVIALDLTGEPAITQALTAVCAAAGTTLQVFGTGASGYYEPFRDGDPAHRASLLLAMVSLDGPASQYRRSCEAYLLDVFELLDAAPGNPLVSVLDDVIHLLNPLALQARMEYVPLVHPRRDALAERIRVSVQLVRAEPQVISALARQLGELRASRAAQWLGPGGGEPGARIDLDRVVRERTAALFPLGADPRAAGIARVVASDILGAGAELRRIGVEGDGIVWLCGCENLPAQMIANLVSGGAASGLPVLATTTSARSAAELAGLMNTLVIHQLTDVEVARSLAGRTGQRLVPAASPGLPAPAALSGAAASGAAPGGASPAGDLPAFVARPVVGPQEIRMLRPLEFFLVVNGPRPRLVELAQALPARLPGPATGVAGQEHALVRRTAMSYGEVP
jgi:hypothetical protein